MLLTLAAGALLAADKKRSKRADLQAAGPKQMDDSRRALHALNRLTFGPRPGDVEQVERMGVDRWIDLQLHPEKIDDSALQARLGNYQTLAMSSRELLEKFPPPFVLKAVETGRMSMPSDPNERAVYQSQIAAYRRRQENKAAQGQNANDNADPKDVQYDEKRAERREQRMDADLAAEKILALPADQRVNAILKLSPDERTMMARSLSPADRERLFDGMTPQQRETVMAMASPRLVVAGEMQSAKLLRAAYGERQLEEVMADFWFNHFNVYDKKGPTAYLIDEYERDAIRPHVLGKFQDLLLATAKSPAMLFYLDNWQSVGPGSDFAADGGRQQQFAQRRQRRFGGPFGQQPRMQRNDPNQQTQQQARPRRSGLNENYAREVMELHTLGVDGGYTQQDVTELAKVLTGWTIRQPRLGGDFEFNARMHEPGSKTVLGRTFSGGGESEGEEALKMLARHPSTARFISKKLAMRFVSDDPTPALVDRMAQTFLRSDGDIRQVLRTMFHSPEFWAQDAYRAKVKTPFEFVVSAVRATGADVQNPMPLAQQLNKMGMPLYGMQPPTGYSMKADAWVNSAALINRMNFSLALGLGRVPGTKLDENQLFAETGRRDGQAALALLEQQLLAGDVSPQTHDTIQKQLTDPQVTGAKLDDETQGVRAGVIAGLILGSPEFQKR
ncbi:MAG TPA: DUF1800 family protein [Terriglobales bacterium]|nr:DUF1800 family protein [Terriglobales bacterium]